MAHGKALGGTTTARGTETAGRVADVLLLFLRGDSQLGVSAIARALGLSKTVVHRTLTTLVERELLQSDPTTRAYRLGPAAAALGARAWAETDLRTTALPEMRRLQRLTGETVTVSARVGAGRVYLDQIVSTREITMTVALGRVFPLHAGSSSLVMLTFLDEDEREAILTAPMPQLTSRTLTDPDTIRLRIDGIRRTGVAHSDGERQEGAGSVAAPLFDMSGAVIGAISVCGPIQRVNAQARESFVAPLLATAERVSRQLGFHGPLPWQQDLYPPRRKTR